MISNIVGARLNLYMFIICFSVIKFHKLFPLKCVQFVVFEGPFFVHDIGFVHNTGA